MPTPVPTPEPTPQSRVQLGAIEVTADMRAAGITSAEDAAGQMIRMAAASEGYTAENTVTYDAKLLVSDANGSWTVVPASSIPAEGVTVTLPYPTGTGQNGYDFTVIHMLSRGENAGRIEILVPVKTAEGLSVTVTGFSPFAVAWKATGAGQPVPVATLPPSVVVATPTPNIINTSQTPVPGGTNGGSSGGGSVLPWVLLCVVVLAGGAAVVIQLRKRK